MPQNTTKQPKEIMEILTIFYRLDQKFNYIRTHLCVSSNGCDELLKTYRIDINRVQRALKNMTTIDSYIVTQTFHYDGTFSNEWWKGIYAHSTFYRMRKRAIRSFLKEYHSIC